MTGRIKLILTGTAVMIAGVIFATTAVHSVWYAPEAPATGMPSSTSAAAMVSAPAKLIIPKLGINANVQYVGINAIGNMMAPSNFSDVGWYKLGTIPGEAGSAIIDGHVDNGLGLDGVFKHINQLVPGDEIMVQAKDGTTIHFIVENTASYAYTDAPTSTIFLSNDGKAHLNLITCEGAWVASGDTYDHRLVIFSTERS